MSIEEVLYGKRDTKEIKKVTSNIESKYDLKCIIFSHCHGTDILPCKVNKENLPEITNELLQSLGVSDPELEREDEFAEWYSLSPTKHWRIV